MGLQAHVVIPDHLCIRETYGTGWLTRAKKGTENSFIEEYSKLVLGQVRATCNRLIIDKYELLGLVSNQRSTRTPTLEVGRSFPYGRYLNSKVVVRTIAIDRTSISMPLVAYLILTPSQRPTWVTRMITRRFLLLRFPRIQTSPWGWKVRICS